MACLWKTQKKPRLVVCAVYVPARKDSVLPKSNSPLSLTVVSVTMPGDVTQTSKNILNLDADSFGFSHDRTWNSMPAALTGKFTRKSAFDSLAHVHPRIRESVATLCDIGHSEPRDTRAFSAFPSAGIRPVQGLRISEECVIRAKATCWYVEKDIPVIPILQPRKAQFQDIQLARYCALARKAFCNGDWSAAQIGLVDLAGGDGSYSLLSEHELPAVDDDALNEFVATYLQGFEMAKETRAAYPEKYKARGKKPPEAPLFDWL